MISKNKQNTNIEDKKIFLDYASSTPILPEIIAEIDKYKDIYYNPSSIYNNGVLAKNIINNSRENIAKILSCHNNEIYFCSSGTESINMAISGVIKNYYINNIWIENKKNTKNEIPIIVTTNIEHPAVLETIKWYERMNMIKIIYLEVNNEGKIKLQDLRDILEDNNLHPNILMVSIMYVNNEIGSVLPVKEIGKIITDYNREHRGTHNKIMDKIIYHIDACQAVNYYEINIRKLRADLLTINSAKIYGGKGGAILYKSNNIQIEPIIYGGGQQRGLRSGTENIQSIVAISKAIEIANRDRVIESERLREIQEYFFKEILIQIPECKIWGCYGENIEYRSPNNINISLPYMLSDEMIIRLDNIGFMVSHKSACDSYSDDGSYVLIAVGASQTEARENIRITTGRETSIDDIKALIKAISNIYYKYKNIK